MKKIILVVLMGVFAVTTLSAQNAKSIQNGKGGERAVTDLVCPNGSLYSQTPDGVNGFSYIAGYRYYDNVITAPVGPVYKISWWMLEFYPVANLSFDIGIYDNNVDQPGAEIASYTNVAFTAVNTGELSYGYPVYEYSFTFPSPVTIPAGAWIGIRDLPDDTNLPNFGHHHYWASSADGDNSHWLGEGSSDIEDLAFCLTGETAPPPEVPVSNWALFIGLGLILVFTVVRFRKQI
jgi:hypothetical protein